MERALHILKDRKGNNLSASDQKYLVSHKACPLYLLDWKSPFAQIFPIHLETPNNSLPPVFQITPQIIIFLWSASKPLEHSSSEASTNDM